LQIVAVATRVAPALDPPIKRDESELNAAKVVVSCRAAGIRVQAAALNAIASATAVVVESGIDSSCGRSKAEERKELHLVGYGKREILKIG
jgi:hypothetical protein